MSHKRNPEWVRIGRELRRLRVKAGLTQEQLGNRVKLSYGTISAIERGIRGTRPEYLVQIDRALSTGGVLAGMWDGIREGYGLASWYRHSAAETEKQARVIRLCQSLLVPGLLQSEGYMRTVISRTGQAADTVEEIEEGVRARVARRAIMESDDPPVVQAVIDEPVLRRPIGGRATMVGQLEHLLKATEGDRVVLQVVPATSGYHPGLDGAFHLYTTHDRRDVVYTETWVSGALIDDPEIVDLYKHFWEEVRGRAFPPEESYQLMERIREEFLQS